MKSVSTKAVASSASIAVPPSASPSTEPVIAVPAVRVLKIASCPSLSGKSTLTYELGCTTDSEIQLRISANTGGGFFSQEWISLKSIEQILEKTAKGTPITTCALRGLFAGKSVNTAGFILSVLNHVDLVQPLKDKRRCFETIDPGLFVSEITALIDSPVDLTTDKQEQPSAPGKKAASKGKQKPA